MKNNKTPYEIRSDLLHLAHSIVRGRKEAEAAANASEDSNGKMTILVKEAPTSEEVIAEANKLNSFVSQSTDNR